MDFLGDNVSSLYSYVSLEYLTRHLDSGRATLPLWKQRRKGCASATDPIASQVNARGRSSRATNNRTSHPTLWEHTKHYKLLENSHGHHGIPQEFRHDLPLINAR